MDAALLSPPLLLLLCPPLIVWGMETCVKHLYHHPSIKQLVTVVAVLLLVRIKKFCILIERVIINRFIVIA